MSQVTETQPTSAGRRWDGWLSEGPRARFAIDLLKYGLASAAALTLDASVLLLLSKAGVNYLVAAAFGFLAGLSFVYFLSVRFVFGGSRVLRPSQEAVGFLVIGLIGLGLNEALMGLFVGEVGLPPLLAKVVTAGFVFIFNFLARRSLLFSKGLRARAALWAASLRDGEAFRSRLQSVPIWVIVSLAMIAAVCGVFPHMTEVWRSGAFFDTDDAMRAVQVRDFLAGQPWFDLTAWRLDPPSGVFSHWSRVIDVPLAGLQLLLRSFLSPQIAELATRIVFPLSLLALLFRLSPALTTTLSPTAPRQLAVLLGLLSGAVYLQFLPGRIDHHAPQIVLLMTCLVFFLRGLNVKSAKSMAASSAAMAASMAISLENLPFFAVMLGGLLALFVIDGGSLRRSLGWFGGAALACFPLAYLATVGPSRYFVSACDAFSWVYVASFVVGSGVLLCLAGLEPFLAGKKARLWTAGLACVILSTTFVGISPSCLGDPLGGIDPVVRELWLSRVTEATPLWKFWKNDPSVIAVTALPVLFGLIVALIESRRAEGVARRRWVIAAGVIAMGFVLGFFWQVRIFSSVTPLAMAPLAGVVYGLAQRWGARFSDFTQALLAVVLCFAVTPVGLASVFPAHEAAAASGAVGSGPLEAAGPNASGSEDLGQKQKSEKACLRPEVLKPLGGLPSSRVAATFDIGPYLLAYTGHSALAGPYHRDNHGNRIVIDAFLAEPQEAREILRGAGAELLLWCVYESDRFAKRAPQGLAAQLAAGRIPGWLEPLPQSGVALKAFVIKDNAKP